MGHFNEYVGTLAVLMFDLLVALFIYLLAGSDVTKWVVVLLCIAFGAVALCATYSVVAYWTERIFGRFRKKKDE